MTQPDRHGHNPGKDWLEHIVGLVLLFLSLVTALVLLIALAMAIAGVLIEMGV